MKLQKGDKVRFLDSVGEGEVTKISTDGTVFVLDETGFEIPVNQEDLIKIGHTATTETPVKSTNVSEPEQEIGTFYPNSEIVPGNDRPKAFFAMVPESGRDYTDADLRTYIINDSNYIIFYNLIEQTKEKTIGVDAGLVEANTKVELFTLLRLEIAKAADYIFQITFYKKGNYQPVSPIEKTIVISPIKLYKENTFKENDFFYEKALIFDLTEKSQKETEEQLQETETMQKLRELQQMVNAKATIDLEPKRTIKKVEPETKREIDLHINELIDNVTGLTNSDILEIQMKKFHDEMKSAIKDNIKRIVFIHGIGNGTLKNEVRKTLTNKFSKYEFHDASYKEYGFGATLVILAN